MDQNAAGENNQSQNTSPQPTEPQTTQSSGQSEHTDHIDQIPAAVLSKKNWLLFGIVIVVLLTIGLSAILYTILGQKGPVERKDDVKTVVRPSTQPTSGTANSTESEKTKELVTAIIKDKNSAYAIEYCDYPWDFKPTTETPADKECIEIEMAGNVRKTFYGSTPVFDLLYSNLGATETQYASTSATALRMYQQFTEPAVFEWLQKPKVPPVGSTYSHIKLHAIQSSDYEVIGSYTVTVDQSPSYDKVSKIIEEMKAIAK